MLETETLSAKMLLVEANIAFRDGDLFIQLGQCRMYFFTYIVIAGHQVVGHGKFFGGLMKS